MELDELLAELGRRRIALQAESGQLRVDAPAGAASADIVEALRAHKNDLLARLSRLTLDDPPPGRDLPALVRRPEDRHAPFPLTDIQQAYWVGRREGVELGAAIHVYVELDAPGLDVARLQRAWNRLVTRHEMLRAVVTEDGEQRVLGTVPDYEIEVQDLRAEPAGQRARVLAELRERMSHQVLPLGRWPLFELRAVLLPAGLTRLFLDVDCTLIDSWGVQLLFRELVAAYRDPDAELPPPFGVSFRDYVLSTRGAADGPAAGYWDARLATLPAAPELPLRSRSALSHRPRFRRWAARVSPATTGC